MTIWMSFRLLKLPAPNRILLLYPSQTTSPQWRPLPPLSVLIVILVFSLSLTKQICQSYHLNSSLICISLHILFLMLDYLIASSHDQVTGRVWVLRELSEPPTLPAKTLGYLLFKNSTLIWEKDELDGWRAEDKDLPCSVPKKQLIWYCKGRILKY